MAYKLAVWKIQQEGTAGEPVRQQVKAQEKVTRKQNQVYTHTTDWWGYEGQVCWLMEEQQQKDEQEIRGFITWNSTELDTIFRGFVTTNDK